MLSSFSSFAPFVSMSCGHASPERGASQTLTRFIVLTNPKLILLILHLLLKAPQVGNLL
ncbi:hypothetical protein [Brasilonema sp. UFV-L1]|uniref:hypothetical protein n=1 Tax=Brasilonema sp. UFV-L1 TaxID=2234130 RepID=UPI00403F046B